MAKSDTNVGTSGRFANFYSNVSRVRIAPRTFESKGRQTRFVQDDSEKDEAVRQLSAALSSVEALPRPQASTL